MKRKSVLLVLLVLTVMLAPGCSAREKPQQVGSNPLRETTAADMATEKTTTSSTSPETKTPAPAPTPDEYKAACGTAPYDELARFPDRNIAKQLVMTGEIIQVIESETGGQYRLKLNDDYDQIVLVVYEGSFDQGKILDGDTVTFWGLYAGTISYDSTMGGEITIPGMMAYYYGMNV